MSSPRLGDESLPQPTEAQQRVIDRIAAQRLRLDARRVQRAQQKAVLPAHSRSSAGAGGAAGAPVLMQVVALGRQYPVAVVSLVAVAMVAAGPKRVVRWLGVALPLIMRLRGR